MNASNFIREKYNDGTILIAMILVSLLPLLIAGIRAVTSDIIIAASNGNFQPLLLTIGLFGPFITAAIIITMEERQ